MQVRVFKTCKKWTPAYKNVRKMMKYIFCITAHTLIEKQSN